LAEIAQLLGVEPMKKAANCMSLAAFVMRYGGAMRTWVQIHVPDTRPSPVLQSKFWDKRPFLLTFSSTWGRPKNCSLYWNW